MIEQLLTKIRETFDELITFFQENYLVTMPDVTFDYEDIDICLTPDEYYFAYDSKAEMILSEDLSNGILFEQAELVFPKDFEKKSKSKTMPKPKQKSKSCPQESTFDMDFEKIYVCDSMSSVSSEESERKYNVKLIEYMDYIDDEECVFGSDLVSFSLP